MNLAPTSSTTAALAMGDALAMALLEVRGLRPGRLRGAAPARRAGLAGRSSACRDLMHTGEALPVVSDTGQHEGGHRRDEREAARA